MPYYTFIAFCADASPLRQWRLELPDDLTALNQAQQARAMEASLTRITVLQDFRHVGHVPGSGAMKSIVEIADQVARTRKRIRASLALLEQTRVPAARRR